MTGSHRRKRQTIIHPFLVVCAPTLMFYGQNRDLFDPVVILAPLLAGVVLAAISWMLLRFIVGDWVRAGIVATFGLFAVLSYGHLRDILWPLLSPFSYGRPIRVCILIGWLLLVPVMAFVLARSRRDLSGVNRILNVAGLALVALPLVNFAIQTAGDSGSRTALSQRDCAEMGIPDRSTTPPLPDIYYIILDGFGRADILEDIYHAGKSDLLDYLEERGFYVGSKSAANYCQTLLSLASSLNYTYLHGAGVEVELPTRRRHLTNMIRHSRAGRVLSCIGYRIVACASGYKPSEIRNADAYFYRPANPWRYNDFQEGLIQTTVLSVLLTKSDWLFGLGAQMNRLRAKAHQERILYAYDVLSNLPKDPTATFAIVHIIAPHPPFVFDEDGPRQELAKSQDFRDGSHLHGFAPEARQEYITDYIGQLKFVERRTIAALEALFATSGPRPIIIVQGDHGPGYGLQWESVDSSDVRERLAILNAYYLPNGGDTLLYGNITPVNTFRVILSHYFGMDLDYLPDRSYFSRWSDPFDFVDVTDRVAPATD